MGAKSPSIFVSKAKQAGSQTKKIAIGFQTLAALTITVISIICFYKDVETSYRGWGVKMLAIVDLGPTGPVFAMALSIVVTILQVFGYLSLVTGLDYIKENKLNLFITLAATGFDIFLDINALYTPANGIGSLATAIFIATVAYTVFSEVLFAFYAPIAFSLIKTFLEDLDLSFGDSEDKQPSLSQPSPFLGRPPMQGQPPIAMSPERMKNREEMLKNMRGS